MSTTPISPASTTTPTNQPATVSSPSSVLGKDDFLKLLVTQLQNQDPLKPMDNTEFISQMAQFSSLEQMQNMNSSMTSLQATTMIGTAVTWNDNNGNQLVGVVNSVSIASGVVSLQVSNSTSSYTVDLSKVTNITTVPAKSSS